MKILVIGAGAREHALTWKLRQSPRVNEVLVAPGSAAFIPGGGAAVRCVPVLEGGVEALVDVARRERVDLTVVGTTRYITGGVGDAFEAAGLRVVAPKKRCALLASSRIFAKTFLVRNGIPTASFHVSSRHDDALALVRMMPMPLVLTATGPCEGTVVRDLREAEEVLRRLMGDGGRGGAGGELVIEPHLDAPEVSLLAFVDEQGEVVMPLSRRYRRLEDGDRGPYTDGLGACLPPPGVTEETRAILLTQVLHPALQALRREHMGYRGVLHLQVAVTEAGPRVLGIGVGLGEPEAQVVVATLESDVLDLLEATADGRLRAMAARWSEQAACGVGLMSRGSLDAAHASLPFSTADVEGGLVFQDGWKRSEEVRGANLATVVGRGADVAEARHRAYAILASHALADFHYRRDIGAETAACVTAPSRKRHAP